MYTYTYIKTTINENRGDEFEREQEGMCGKFGGNKNSVIVL